MIVKLSDHELAATSATNITYKSFSSDEYSDFGIYLGRCKLHSLTSHSMSDEAAPTTPPVIGCSKCGKSSVDVGFELMTCSGCKNNASTTLVTAARYCSKECQKADWKVHKKVCPSATAKSKPKPKNQETAPEVTADGSGFMTFEDYMGKNPNVFSDPITAMMNDGALESGWEDELGAAVNEAIEAGLMEGGNSEGDGGEDQDKS